MATLSTVAQGVATAKSSRYRAQIADRNAAMDRNSAQDALARGRIQEERQGRRTRQLVGEQRVAMAANGVEVDFGSAGALQDDTRMIGFEDAQTIRENAARESQGYEIRAWNSRADAVNERANAKAALWSTALDAGSTMLAGAQQYRRMRAPTLAGRAASGGGGGSGWAFPGPPGY